MAKSTLTIFPYQQNPEGQFFPIIPIRFYLNNKVIDSSALIDSGATISIFRLDVADYLGLKIERGKKVFLGGVGGRIKGYLHKLPVEIANKKLLLPIVFSYEYTVSLNLLGRQEFFKNFTIVFNEKKEIVELK